MEITVSLPISDWYRNTPENELLYWGLDYPPLTAYVSYLFGKCAEILCPDLVRLFSSRGHESVEGKTFLRFSVILMDLLVVIPAVVMCCKRIVGKQKTQWTILDVCYCLSCLLLPGLLLVDHGHFQYNGVCLGLALAGALLILDDRDVLGSIAFCLSLNFKQMSLYYAPVFFCCLLRKCLCRKSFGQKLWAVAQLGITVLVTFGVLWFPFCVFHAAEETCASSLLLVLGRQFPFSRGIFEDKVANLWYAASVAVDFRQLLSQQQLVLCSLGLTLLLVSPVCYGLLSSRLTTRRLLLALMNGSLAFFLASYQVHEKSVLLALFPASLLITADPLFVGWFQVLGTFTMFPLLKRDQLALPYVLCTGIYLCLVGLLADTDVQQFSRGEGSDSQDSKSLEDKRASGWWKWARRGFVALSCTGEWRCVQLLKLELTFCQEWWFCTCLS